MIIREANLISFGKLQNRQYTFSPGINVVYGLNESGKSTLMQFLKAMLFGLEKTRMRKTLDDYKKYEPWDTPAYFAGSIVFDVGTQRFLLERNFYYKEKRARLVNLGDGEELSPEQGDLQMLLGNVSAGAYENTCCIGQERQLPDEGLGILLEDEKSSLAQTGEAGFQLSRALASLNDRKKAFERQKKELAQEREQTVRRLQVQATMLREDLGSLRSRQQDNADEMRRVQTEIARTAKKDGKTQEEPKRLQWNAWVVAGVAGEIVINCFRHMFPVAAVAYALMLVFGILLVFGLVQAYRRRQTQVSRSSREQSEEAQRQQELALKLESLKGAKEQLEAQQQEKEIRLENLSEQLRELQYESDGEREMTERIRAAELAAETITRLSGELSEDMEDGLNARMSAILSDITSGKYDALAVDGGGAIAVSDRLQQRQPEAYSRATMQQMYFAYRMAAGELLVREEPLPYLLDEAFAGYDETRLRSVLRWLAEQGTQVFLFTCRELEADVLTEEGIPYTKICL